MKKLFYLFLLFFITLNAQTIINILNEPIQAIQKKTIEDENKVNLGKKLFFDKRLSRDNTISCLSCHNVDFGGVDNLEKSFGVENRIGNINTPTVLNSSLNFVQFWDGRAKSLKEQIDFPIHEPVEMDTNWDDIINKINKIPSYQRLFALVYDNNFTKENIKDAIVAYEESLVMPSRFDKFLLGDQNAISDEEFKGYELFKSYGCISCHQGQNVGGNFYEKLGVFKPYPHIDDKNYYGRYNQTGIEEDKFEFKVPSLRNIVLTYPYLHDGSISDLDEVIVIMAEYQLGREIPYADVESIKAFLKSLTSEEIEIRYDKKEF